MRRYFRSKSIHLRPRWCLLGLVALALSISSCGVSDKEYQDTDAGEERSFLSGLIASSDRMTVFEFVDNQGFEEPLVAATANIPVKWTAQGDVLWDRRSDCVSNHVRMRWLATSPDGKQGIELIPGFTWQVMGTQFVLSPCPVLAVRTPQQLLSGVAQRYPGVRVHGYRDRPDLAARVEIEDSSTRSIWAEAGELSISYPSGSQTIYEALTVAIKVYEEPLTTNPPQTNVTIVAQDLFAHRALDRQPDAGLGDAVRASMQLDPHWKSQAQAYGERFVADFLVRQRAQIDAWHANQMARINAQGAMARSQIWAQTQRDIAQMRSNTWANTQAVNDRIHSRTLEGIGEYNSYADPIGGGVVRESIQFDRVLRTDGGGYISTNDPNVNPPGAQELKRIR